MENTISRGRDQSELVVDTTAQRNTGRPVMEQVKLALLWLAVILPMVWGALDAIRDVRYLFP
jgi:hypothetical protein